ncbi:MAG TPA: hypothetical protein VMB85_18795 [Bryobacteraceae bacterium]|nr:hypothetical protein [Bryobacteraceae bacterium]
MAAAFDPDLQKINLDSEIALRRLQKMVEFLRVVREKEMQLLNPPENYTDPRKDPSAFINFSQFSN